MISTSTLLNALKQNTFLIFVICFIVYYNIFINKDPKGVFFILTILIILYILYSQKLEKDEQKNNNLTTYIDNVENQLKPEYEVPENKFFNVHKTPMNIKYIKKNEQVKQILYDLKFLQIYDKELYEKIVSYLEYFLKIHYNVMLGKYDFDLYFQVLLDLRAEILNSMKTIYFNIPNISTILDIKNLDTYVEKRILAIQALTFKYMRIVYNKYNTISDKSYLTYEPPFQYDKIKDKHYSLF